MAQIITNISQSLITGRLDTYNHTADAAGPYSVRVQADIIPPSGFRIEIKLNGVTQITSLPAGSAMVQNNIGAQKVLNCAQGDLISIVLRTIASNPSIDRAPNVIKATINIHKGL